MTADALSRVFHVGVEECKGKVPVYATIPETRTGAATIERCRLAAAAGVDAIQVFFPDGGHGMRPRPNEQERYYRDLLSKVQYPLAISAHQHSGFLPKVKLLKALCDDHPQVVASMPWSRPWPTWWN
jgi:dihydrodipicolinate synthase/N-acetylneuraminate lyase